MRGREGSLRMLASRGVLFALLLSTLLGGIATRGTGILGMPLQYDEPFWLLRGDFLIQALIEGNWDALRRKIWFIEDSNNGEIHFAGHMGTGMGTALLAGASRSLLDSGEKGSPLYEVAVSRVGNAMLGALTPLLLLLLARKAGLSLPAQVAFSFFMVLDPVIRTYGAVNLMEPVLVLVVPASMMLHLIAEREGKMWWSLSAGAVFGFGFATRLNAVVSPVGVVLLALSKLRFKGGMRGVSEWVQKETPRLLGFALAGYLVFLLLIPPIWTDPFGGFAAFLTQSGAKRASFSVVELFTKCFPSTLIPTGPVFLVLSLVGCFRREVVRDRLFQTGIVLFCCGLLLTTKGASYPYARYVACLMPGLGLAGAVSFGNLWERFQPNWFSVKTLVGGLAFATLLGSAGLGYRDWQRFNLLEQGYAKVVALGFNRAVVEDREPKLAFRRSSPKGESRTLFLRNKAWHVPLYYLGVSLEDKRSLFNLGIGWDRHIVEATQVRPQPGDWVLEEVNPREESLPDELRIAPYRILRID